MRLYIIYETVQNFKWKSCIPFSISNKRTVCFTIIVVLICEILFYHRILLLLKGDYSSIKGEQLLPGSFRQFQLLRVSCVFFFSYGTYHIRLILKNRIISLLLLVFFKNIDSFIVNERYILDITPGQNNVKLC